MISQFPITGPETQRHKSFDASYLRLCLLHARTRYEKQ